MAQTKTIQLLRSSSVYASLEAAKTALQTNDFLEARKDGEILLARYNHTNGNVTTVKSLVAVYHKAPDLPAGTASGVTFIEDITSAAGTSAALQAEIDAIESSVGLNSDGTKSDFTDTDALDVISASDTLMSAIEKVAKAIGGMDKAANAVAGQVVTTIAQANGSVTETKANVKDLQLGGYSKDANATGAIGSTDTVNTALSKLENAIDANDVHSDDQSITVTDDVDGGTNIEVNVDGTTIVKDATSHALKSGLTLTKITTDLGTNVKEAYQLQNASGTQIGDQIDIYKDSALKEVYLGASTDTIDASTGVITKNTVTDPQSMNFAYQLADGTYSLTKIDVSKFLTESEFGDGLQVSGAGVVSVKVGNGLEIDGTSKAVNVKIDSTSESFLTVGANGVKLSGVQSAINTAIEGLDVTDTAVAGQYVSAVSETDGEITVSRANVSEAVLNNYAKGTAPQSPDIAATDTINEAFAKLEHKVAAGVSSLDAEVTSTDGRNVQVKVTEVDGIITAVNVTTDNTVNSTDVSNAITNAIGALDADLDASGNAQHNGTFVMSGVTEVDGVLTAVDSVEVENAGAAAAAKATIDAYTVNNKAISTSPVLDGSDIAMTGYTKGSDATAIAATDTVNQAVSKLENQIDAVETTANGALQSVSSGNGAIAVGTEDANHDQSIRLVLDTTTATHNITSDMLQITSNGLMMNDAWDCGTY